MSRDNSFGKWLVVGILVVIAIIASAYPRSAPIKPILDINHMFGALGSVFMIVLLVERATEIVITVWRQTETEMKKAHINSLNLEISKKPQADLSAELLAEQKRLASYQTETKRIALLTGLTISVLLCATGVGLLEVVIDRADAEIGFIRFADIVLTSGLIAGGSDGFHKFVSTLETFFIESKKKMEGNA